MSSDDVIRRLDAGESVPIEEVNALLIEVGEEPIDITKTGAELAVDLVALTGLSIEELQAITGRKLTP